MFTRLALELCSYKKIIVSLMNIRDSFIQNCHFLKSRLTNTDEPFMIKDFKHRSMIKLKN